MAIKIIIVQVEKEINDLNGAIPPAVNAPSLEMRKENNLKPLQILIFDDMPVTRRYSNACSESNIVVNLLAMGRKLAKIRKIVLILFLWISKCLS
jgi:hypothetical protein